MNHLKQAESNETADKEFDFMISSHIVNREMCYKIKKSLESHKFKVWIEDDNRKIWANVDEATKAIEGSKCILMCVTEKYRQSVFGRLEVEHANRFNKKIIPLIMQKGYGQVGGWLGSIMVNFLKIFSFGRKLKELRKNLLFHHTF